MVHERELEQQQRHVSEVQVLQQELAVQIQEKCEDAERFQETLSIKKQNSGFLLFFACVTRITDREYARAWRRWLEATSRITFVFRILTRYEARIVYSKTSRAWRHWVTCTDRLLQREAMILHARSGLPGFCRHVHFRTQTIAFQRWLQVAAYYRGCEQQAKQLL